MKLSLYFLWVEKLSRRVSKLSRHAGKLIVTVGEHYAWASFPVAQSAMEGVAHPTIGRV